MSKKFEVSEQGGCPNTGSAIVLFTHPPSFYIQTPRLRARASSLTTYHRPYGRNVHPISHLTIVPQSPLGSVVLVQTSIRLVCCTPAQGRYPSHHIIRLTHFPFRLGRTSLVAFRFSPNHGKQYNCDRHAISIGNLAATASYRRQSPVRGRKKNNWHVVWVRFYSV